MKPGLEKQAEMLGTLWLQTYSLGAAALRMLPSNKYVSETTCEQCVNKALGTVEWFNIWDLEQATWAQSWLNHFPAP